jgi:hypothetical protein
MRVWEPALAHLDTTEQRYSRRGTARAGLLVLVSPSGLSNCQYLWIKILLSGFGGARWA